MPRGIKNWKYKNVIKFLNENGFIFSHQLGGSHEKWINEETSCIVEINKHGNKEFLPRTLETMIRQSGIGKKEWRKWAGK